MPWYMSRHMTIQPAPDKDSRELHVGWVSDETVTEVGCELEDAYPNLVTYLHQSICPGPGCDVLRLQEYIDAGTPCSDCNQPILDDQPAHHRPANAVSAKPISKHIGCQIAE